MRNNEQMLSAYGMGQHATRLAAATAIAAFMALGLTGCGETFDERVDNKAKCEAAGGEYVELINGWTYEYAGWRCDLDTDLEP